MHPSPELCKEVEHVVARQFGTPELTVIPSSRKNYEKARHCYVYVCRIYLNAPFAMIRDAMPVYTDPKTVYQAFRRAYMARHGFDNRMLIEAIKKEMDEKIKERENNVPRGNN